MMRSLCVFLALGLLVLAAPSSASAGVDWSINIDVPVRVPRLVLVQPDVRVVEGVDAEIFYVEGRYWTHRNGYWYSARRHRGNFRRSGDIRVPWQLTRVTPGRYRNYKRGDRRNESRGNSAWGRRRGNHDRNERIAERKAERKADRKDRKNDRKNRKNDRKNRRRARQDYRRH